MRKLLVNTFLSLDGVMQAPGGPGEDPSGGFDLEGWSVNYWDDVIADRMTEFMGKPFDLLLGRKTYEIFAAHWPQSDDPGAAALNKATKYVASRTLTSLEWKPSQLLEGDTAKAVAQLKEQEGPEIQVHGSSNLLQTLIQNDLIDEYNIWIYPLVLGKGKRLFGEGTLPAAMKLVESKATGTGVILTRYQRAGEIETGTFASE